MPVQGTFHGELCHGESSGYPQGLGPADPSEIYSDETHGVF